MLPFLPLCVGTMASTSKESIVKRKRQPLSAIEKTMIWNLFHTLSNNNPKASRNELSKSVAATLGVHWMTVFRLLREKRENGDFKSPKKFRERIRKQTHTIDTYTKLVLCNIMHQFHKQNEVPTLNKIMNAGKEDISFSKFKRTTLYSIIKKMGFDFSKYGKFKNDDAYEFWKINYPILSKVAKEEKTIYLSESQKEQTIEEIKIYTSIKDVSSQAEATSVIEGPCYNKQTEASYFTAQPSTNTNVANGNCVIVINSSCNKVMEISCVKLNDVNRDKAEDLINPVKVEDNSYKDEGTNFIEVKVETTDNDNIVYYDTPIKIETTFDDEYTSCVKVEETSFIK